jgi:hypothetical protein
MDLGTLLTAISEMIVGDGTDPGLLGDDFGLFIAVGLVASLAVTQLPKLAKRLR